MDGRGSKGHIRTLSGKRVVVGMLFRVPIRQQLQRKGNIHFFDIGFRPPFVDAVLIPAQVDFFPYESLLFF